MIAPTGIADFSPRWKVRNWLRFDGWTLGQNLGQGIEWSTATGPVSINLNVNFVVTSTFSGALFGKAK